MTLVINDKVSLGGITMGTVVALVAYHLFRVVNNPEDAEHAVVAPTDAFHEDDDDDHGPGHGRHDDPPRGTRLSPCTRSTVDGPGAAARPRPVGRTRIGP